MSFSQKLCNLTNFLMSSTFIALLDKSNTICNACYPIGEVCRHLLDSQVIEDFIEGLQYFQKAVMVANYTEQLFKNLEEVSVIR